MCAGLGLELRPTRATGPGLSGHSCIGGIIKGSYTKEEGMQLIETAKFELLLKIA